MDQISIRIFLFQAVSSFPTKPPSALLHTAALTILIWLHLRYKSDDWSQVMWVAAGMKRVHWWQLF